MPMTYAYDELFEHMRPSTVSPWTNNWFDVYDFTPHKTAPTGEPNFFLAGDLVPEFMVPLEKAKLLIQKVGEIKGTEFKSLA